MIGVGARELRTGRRAYRVAHPCFSTSSSGPEGVEVCDKGSSERGRKGDASQMAQAGIRSGRTSGMMDICTARDKDGQIG